MMRENHKARQGHRYIAKKVVFLSYLRTIYCHIFLELTAAVRIHVLLNSLTFVSELQALMLEHDMENVELL